MSGDNIPETWLICNLPEFVYFQEGPGLRKFQYKETGIPFLNIRTLVNERVEKSLCGFLDETEVNNKYQHFLLNEGDIVCSSSGTIGKTAIISRDDLPLMLNTSIIRFRSLNENIISTVFVYYFLKSNHFLIQTEKSATGTAQRNIGPSHLKEFVIPIPPLAEQQQIAAKLDELLAQVDTIKTRLDTIPKILKRFRQSVLAAAVSGKLTEDWRNEHRELGEWTATNFGNLILDSGNGISKRSGNQGRDVTVLRLADFKNAKRINGNERKITLTENEIYKYCLRDGDLLVVRVNGSVDIAGLFIIYSGAEEEAYCDHFIRFSIDPKQSLSEFITYITNEGEGRQYLKNSLSTSAGQNTINQKSIFALQVRLPPVLEQTEIVRRVEQIFAYADQIEQRVKDAQALVNHLTQSILAKAFRGEFTADWRTQNPELISGENSATALLAKIQAKRLIGKTKTQRKAKA